MKKGKNVIATSLKQVICSIKVWYVLFSKHFLHVGDKRVGLFYPFAPVGVFVHRAVKIDSV